MIGDDKSSHGRCSLSDLKSCVSVLLVWRKEVKYFVVRKVVEFLSSEVIVGVFGGMEFRNQDTYEYVASMRCACFLSMGGWVTS